MIRSQKASGKAERDVTYPCCALFLVDFRRRFVHLFSISLRSFSAFFAFLLRWGWSAALPFARRAAARPLDIAFPLGSLSALDSDALTPSSVFRRRWSRHDSTSGCTLNFRSLIMRLSSRTISREGSPVLSARKTLMSVSRQRSEDCRNRACQKRTGTHPRERSLPYSKISDSARRL